ncbi:S1 family peptidase [Planctomicrobium piriforme]|uniref:Trypsin-like peptidase domain-containing protein n=1 Tax=Planctomicrobium piriforme TaxID=1576369 RepID=A0A1I3QBT8_9PLAN|nr:serine protease [Planctomicrobium piriforme]SFJ31145.1 Trypsin-like peptidase domain-containing protein [Planctomicrobium piriforme]
MLSVLSSTRRNLLVIATIGIVVQCSISTAVAQKNDIEIQLAFPLRMDGRICEQLEELWKDGKLTCSREKMLEQIEHPVHQRFELPAPSTEPRSGAEIYKIARESHVRLGHGVRNDATGKWVFNGGAGYVIAPGGIVATCCHCLETPPVPADPAFPDRERTSWLFAVTMDGKVYPATSVLAANDELDAAIVQVEGLPNRPIALNEDVTPGDTAYLFSEPFGVRGYFSNGIINRFYWLKDPADPQTLAGAARYRINIGTDWAPGSSGAAVIDTYGNVIGHVSRISALQPNSGEEPSRPDSAKADENQKPTPRESRGPQGNVTFMVLHEAIPARGVRLLAEKALEPPSEEEQQPE